MRPIPGLLCAAIVAAVCAAGPLATADAATITFVATDLADVLPGEDLWRYEYVVSGFDFLENQGFSIEFDDSLYSDLEDPPPPVSPDWDIISLQPDPGVPAPGLYDALALTDHASLGQTFGLTFVWLGGAAQVPGAQPFTISQFDAAGALLGVLDSGSTAAVPEPSTMLLLGSALALSRLRRRRNRHRHVNS